ncbi:MULTISPECIES: ABC transporter substrate-binding protein [unclassified Chelatococcus]|uniref:ABC transporter substrate-binding protein n=1 Tax=unclassified Chelatococcus TaxID=2638111 RepID=UPI001BCD3A4D|nr:MULTISPECIES: ABC transporter substrate-binding protein [unclassified Chelatococcus]MBS7701191.1 ABC transporter substrate-binding protein [Chelatococcus sp. YT9]MBX3557322.1 ABC transporter substrate-binding protein [Chelatococcus sp.]
MLQARQISVRLRLGLTAVSLSAALVTGGVANAQNKNAGELVVLSLGGSYQDAQSKEWFKPFAEQSGVKVSEASGYNFAKLKVMIESGNVEADVVDISADTMTSLADAGLLEKIDWSKIPAECQAGIPADMKKDYAFPIIQWAMVMAYNTSKIPPDKAPKTWADFWNVTAFPGKRASIGATRPPVEQATLAINGDLAKLYPFDLNAAFDKIKTLGSAMIFADGYAQVAQYLADGEADMAIIPNGRIGPLVAAGRPVAINWNQHLTFPNFFAIPKGAPHKDNAMKFLGYVCQPEVLARIAAPTNYGPINVDAYKFIPADVAKLLPGNPETVDLGRPIDTVFLSKVRPDIAKGWARMAVR